MEHLKHLRGLFRLTRSRTSQKITEANKPTMQRPRSDPQDSVRDADDAVAALFDYNTPHSCRDLVYNSESETEEHPVFHIAEAEEEVYSTREQDFRLTLPDLTSMSVTDMSGDEFEDECFSDGDDQQPSFQPMFFSSPANEIIVESPSQNDDEETDDSFPSHEYKRLVNEDGRNTLGRGACGFVKRAVHLPTCQIVAIKETPQTESRLHQSQGEFEILCRKEMQNSVHIITVKDSGCEKDVFLLSMELMSGGDLHSFIKSQHSINGAMDERVVAAIAKQICHGLVDLHRAKIIHSDLTARNILLSRDQRDLKISDFGMACDVSQSGGMTSHFGGAFTCLSPERRLGQPYTYSADIFSLGVILWHCLIGREPFGEDSWAVPDFEKLCQQSLLSSVVVSETCLDFILSCLRTDANARPSALELCRHAFVADAADVIVAAGDVGGDTALLREVVETLVEFYQQQSITHGNETPTFLDECSDDEKVENIAQCTGFTCDEVRNFMSRFAGMYRMSLFRRA